jgi:hypothetical protein
LTIAISPSDKFLLSRRPILVFRLPSPNITMATRNNTAPRSQLGPQPMAESPESQAFPNAVAGLESQFPE